MATSKPDILIILLQKLMEEGNVLYKVSGVALFCGVAMAHEQPLSLVHNGRGCAAAPGPRSVAPIDVPREATGLLPRLSYPDSRGFKVESTSVVRAIISE